MRTVPVVLALLLVAMLPVPVGASLDVQHYAYFGNLLNETSAVLEGALTGDVTLDEAVQLLSVANSTYFTLLAYNSSKDVVSLSLAFVELEKGIFLIVNGSLGLNSSLSEGNYELSRVYLLTLLEGVRTANRALGEIGSFSFDSGNETLRFNTKPLEKLVNSFDSLAREKEAFLDSVSGDRFSLFASKERPFVGENVTFFGYAPNVSEVVLHVGNFSVLLPVVGGKFSYTHSFSSPGEFEVYATSADSSEYRSNTLEIEVARVPVFIVAKTCAELSGVCGYGVDALGSPLRNAPLVVRWDGNARTVLTDENGRFSVPINASEKVWVDVLYFGDDVHAPTSVSLEFLPLRTHLLINLKVSHVSPFSETATLVGRIVPAPEEPIVLDVYVDGSLYSSLLVSSGKFEIKIPLDEGSHRVYVVFQGNGRYLPSRSNTVVVAPQPLPLRRIAALLVLIVMAFVAYRVFGREDHEGNVGGKPKESPGSRMSERVFSSVREVYVIVYRALLRIKGLPRSTTPRELLGEFRDSRFSTGLFSLTFLHELEVYRGFKTKVATVRGAVKTASRVLLSAIIGDEL